MSRRSTSTESLTHIPLVDDKSLDSASDNNTDLERQQQQRRRQIKPKKKDVETNTDHAYDSSQHEHSFFDDKGKKEQILIIHFCVVPMKRKLQNLYINQFI